MSHIEQIVKNEFRQNMTALHLFKSDLAQSVGKIYAQLFFCGVLTNRQSTLLRL